MSSKIENGRATRIGGAAWVFVAALALFSTTVANFSTRVTDLSALRLLDGDVPYRDFWTMYAPGSFTTLAVAFGVFGPALIVSNIMGILTSAAAVGVFHRLALQVSGTVTALVSSALVTVALYGTGYHNGFTSYPPALLLILTSVYTTANRSLRDGWRWTLVPGALLGAAIVFKHDIAGYAILATTAALVLTRHRARLPVWAPVVALWAAAAVLPLAAVGMLVSAGAGPDMWRDLVRFPLTDFRHVRPESFPLLPSFGPLTLGTARELVRWGVCNFPLWALLAGVAGLWTRWSALGPTALFVVVASFVAFWFHWSAAHVQLNTHAISLAAWSLLVASAGWQQSGERRRTGWTWAGPAAVLLWAALFVAEPAYRAAIQDAGPREWLGLPGLQGIRVSRANAAWMRQLSADLASVQEPAAPLLVLSSRNDINIYAASTPYWLTTRRPATRYHELHPGITDTEQIQQEMLAAVQRTPLPVVVREHRFADETLDRVKAAYIVHVPVGATLMDEWIAERYEPGRRFGRYELLRRCPC